MRETDLRLTKTWQLGEPIGSGGFGRVVRATSGDAVAAIKFVPKEPGAHRELLFVELDEVTNVIPIIDSGETDDDWVLVMPLAEYSLRQRLDRGELTHDEATAVLTDVATALASLDGRVVHRDLKPQNVLLYEGHWCLADFGISRYAEATTAPDTQKYALTPAYAAPERWRSERATGAADVYSVGVMAHELLAGARPYDGPSTEDFRHQHLHADPPRLEGVGSALAALIDECLYKAPSARPTAANLLARLDRLPTLVSSPGLERLREANSAEVSRNAERSRDDSADRTDAERREDLLAAARRGFNGLSEALREAITHAAPAARLTEGRDGAWSLQLAEATLSMSRLTPTGPDPWRWEPPAFEVIAHASLTISIPQDRYGYSGRAHSLWFCDAVDEGAYGWFETAFMICPMIPRRSTVDPFALDPGEDAAKAVWNGMAEFQTAWPFTPLVLGELDDFIDRWATWFAVASTGGLQHPSTMPEHPANNWRRT